MKLFLIALKLIWKRKYACITSILQILLSIIMLAQLFVFITDQKGKIRTVYELPTKNVAVLSVFSYNDTNYVRKKLETSPLIDSVSQVYMNRLYQNGTEYNLAVYDEKIIENYSPELQSGIWLSESCSVPNGAIPAVVSYETGQKVGNLFDLEMSNEKKIKIAVIGVLKYPSQYFYPSGTASPKYFSADAVIAKEPGIIISAKYLNFVSVIEPSRGLPAPKNLFIFLNPRTSDSDYDNSAKEWGRYGEVTRMSSLVKLYESNTNKLIVSAAILFVVFAVVAVMSILSSNIIQSLHNRNYFVKYYLLGMNWKSCVSIEAYRIATLIGITMILTIFAGKFGLLMTTWMTSTKMLLFYCISFFYIFTLFATVGAIFFIKLTREDISASLKELQQGE